MFQTSGIAFYLPLEDLAGFRARVEAWAEYNEKKLPPCAMWWDGPFDFSEDSISAARNAMEAVQKRLALPVVNITIDPIMAAFGEGTALDEQDFRKRLKAIQDLTEPFPQATAIVAQHAAWTGKHELGSILQRALTATSIKAVVVEKAAALTIVRQKNDEEGKTLNFEIHPLGGKGRIVMVPSEAGNLASKLHGNNRIAYEAIVRAVEAKDKHAVAIRVWMDDDDESLCISIEGGKSSLQEGDSSGVVVPLKDYVSAVGGQFEARPINGMRSIVSASFPLEQPVH